MTRKDYAAIAEGFARTRPAQGRDTRYGANPARDAWQDCVYAIGRVLAGDNPRFSSTVFYAACENGLRSDATRAALRTMRADARRAS